MVKNKMMAAHDALLQIGLHGICPFHSSPDQGYQCFHVWSERVSRAKLLGIMQPWLGSSVDKMASAKLLSICKMLLQMTWPALWKRLIRALGRVALCKEILGGLKSTSYIWWHDIQHLWCKMPVIWSSSLPPCPPTSLISWFISFWPSLNTVINMCRVSGMHDNTSCSDTRTPV